MKFRHWVVKIHGFIGIGMGLLVVVMRLTGAGIVFREELDPILSPALHRVVPQAQAVLIESALEPVQANHRDLPLQFIIFPRTPSETYQIAMKDPSGHRLDTFVNPYTGKVLGERIWEHSPLGFLYTIHEELLTGTQGMIAVGISGVVLLLMSVTGLALWTGWGKLASVSAVLESRGIKERKPMSLEQMLERGY
ncbi:MAG: PepSY domain-containing protein [Thermosynechococcaceae cyanobacterium MS004]|nr:PepSY domain-containing protein [Thermosynechococcaceae cyanobacterium MS004]